MGSHQWAQLREMETPAHCLARVTERAFRMCGVCLLLTFAFSWLGSSPRAEETSRRVLMLHAFNYAFPATTMVADAARKRMLEGSPRKIEIDADFLDLVRVSDPAHDVRTATFLREKYALTPPDVVMTLGSAALPFIIKHRDAIAPKVPVVFTGVSPQNYAATRPPPDVTGIITEFNLDKTLTLAERLQPNARRLFVIAGGSPIDRLWHATARRIIESRERKFETTYLFELPYNALVAELSRVPRDAIVIILTVFVDGEGKAFVPMEVATALAGMSPAPVYAPYDTYLGKGIVGGFVETFESVGIAAADLVLEIIAGKNPATLPLGDVMTPDPEVLPDTASVAFVLNKMSLGGFRHVPVVDHEHRPRCVIAVRDVVEYLVQAFPREVLNLPPEIAAKSPPSREGA